MNQRHLLRRFLAPLTLSLTAAMLLSAAWCQADDSPAPSHRMENRFLFVIETSSGMKARAAGIADAVNELLASDMKGELRKGDTIGLWTYNDRLDTDFPKEVWTDQGKDTVLKEVSAHLGHLRYEKHGYLDRALPSIMQALAHSERLTVILIFDGYDPLKGTPFDKDINALHKHYAGEFRAARIPVVTVMAARQGAIFDYTINYPGEVLIPHTADPLPPPETNTPPVVVAAPPPAPLSETIPPAVPPSSPPIPDPNPPPARLQIVLSGADFVHKTNTPAPTSNAAAIVTPPPAPVPASPSNTSTSAEPAPVAAQTPTAGVTPAQPQHPPTPQATATNSAKTNMLAATPRPPATPPVQPPSVEVAATTGQSLGMFVIAISLLTIAVALVLILWRRGRGAPQPSLISQSMDRPR